MFVDDEADKKRKHDKIINNNINNNNEYDSNSNEGTESDSWSDNDDASESESENDNVVFDCQQQKPGMHVVSDEDDCVDVRVIRNCLCLLIDLEHVDEHLI